MSDWTIYSMGLMGQMNLDNLVEKMRKRMIRIRLTKSGRKFVPKAKRCITK